MKTGIYVYQPTTVVIQTSEPDLKLAKLGGSLTHATLAKKAELQLQPGVYRIMSKAKVSITGAGLGSEFDLQSKPGDKDDWPEPPPKVTATKDEVASFFYSKGGELPGPEVKK